jgi:hypothetical protein
MWSDIKSIGLGSVTYCYEERNEFSGSSQGDTNHICKNNLISESVTAYPLSSQKY